MDRFGSFAYTDWLNPLELTHPEHGSGAALSESHLQLPRLVDETLEEVVERRRWQEWAIAAADQERLRRMTVLAELEEEAAKERKVRREWAVHAIEEEQRRRVSQDFLTAMATTAWFTDTISGFCEDYEVVCPYSHLGCRHICLRNELEKHLKLCEMTQEPEDGADPFDAEGYEVMCPNAVLGCDHTCLRQELEGHLTTCRFVGPGKQEEQDERDRNYQMVKVQAEEERARRVEEQQETQTEGHTAVLHTFLEGQLRRAMDVLDKEMMELVASCKEVRRKRSDALRQVMSEVKASAAALIQGACVVPYGSIASGLMTPHSDVDLVICCPEASSSEDSAITEHLEQLKAVAAHLHEHSPSIKVLMVLEHSRVPIIKAVATVGSTSFPVDISMDAPMHTGIATSAFVAYLSERLPALAPLVIVLKHILQRAGLNDPYNGGLSSYALVLMVVYMLLQQGSTGDDSTWTEALGTGPYWDMVAAECQVAGHHRSKGGHEMQQVWRGARVGRAILMQEFFANAEHSRDLEHSEKNPKAGPQINHVSPSQPPPPFPKATATTANAKAKAKAEPLPSLGKLLVNFLHLFGHEFEARQEGLSVRGGGFRFRCNGWPPHPQAADPVVIEDPLDPHYNNAGRSSYRIGAAQRAMADALARLKSAMARLDVGEGGSSTRPVLSSGVLGGGLELPA
ncbi:unnamed protein product [Chrysoparadoxa australica]